MIHVFAISLGFIFIESLVNKCLTIINIITLFKKIILYCCKIEPPPPPPQKKIDDWTVIENVHVNIS